MYVNVKELPEVLISMLKKVSYNKKDISIEVSEKVSVYCSGGDGRKGFALIVNMSTNEVKEMWGSWGGSNIFNQNNSVDLNTTAYLIPENVAVILGSIGESTYATISLSPKNILPCLQAPEELTIDEKQVLGIIKSYKPAYRKEYLVGKDLIIQSLVDRGYLSKNKAGSVQITTTGKNAAGKVY